MTAGQYATILNAPHVLIAGTTGAGKSVLLNNLVDCAYYNTKAEFYFIDLKMVEFYPFKHLSRTSYYADRMEDVERVLKTVENQVRVRLAYMRKYGLKIYPGNDIYLVVDELAELLLMGGKSVLKRLAQIGVIARAARVHILAATQRPTRDIIGGCLAAVFDCRIGLRTANRQESVNIIGKSGCETLPQYGNGYVLKNGYIYSIEIEKHYKPETA